jgi:predicted transposase YdaD
MEALMSVLMYTFECTEGLTLNDLGWVGEALDDPKGEVVMTLAEKLRQEGWEKGLEQGREKGLEQGHLQGRQEGQRRLLLKQLGLRFGELPSDAVSLVEKAESEDLERWAERILTVRSIEEVLRR